MGVCTGQHLVLGNRITFHFVVAEELADDDESAAYLSLNVDAVLAH